MFDPQILIQSAQDLPPLPTSVTRLASLVAEPEPNIKDIVGVINFDPVLTAKLLKVANSAAYSGAYRSATVKDAVIRLGCGMVLGLAIGASTQKLVQKVIPGYEMSGDDFWRHSVTAALAAEVGRFVSMGRWHSTTFTSALLHDFGKLILGPYITPEIKAWMQLAQEEKQLAPFQAEAEQFTMHHASVGGLIAQRWKLPEVIVQGIRYHHEPELGSDQLGYMTFLANGVAKWIDANQAQQEQIGSSLQTSLDLLKIAPDKLPRMAEMVDKRRAVLLEQYK